MKTLILKQPSKYFAYTCFLIFTFACFILQGCSGGRNLSTPSARLAGHWVAGNGTDHYYFGPLDSSRNGSFAVKFGERVAIHQGYSLVSEIPDGEQVLVMITYSDGSKETDTYYPAKDGSQMKMEKNTTMDGETSTFVTDVTYVDDKTRP